MTIWHLVQDQSVGVDSIDNADGEDDYDAADADREELRQKLLATKVRQVGLLRGWDVLANAHRWRRRGPFWNQSADAQSDYFKLERAI